MLRGTLDLDEPYVTRIASRPESGGAGGHELEVRSVPRRRAVNQAREYQRAIEQALEQRAG